MSPSAARLTRALAFILIIAPYAASAEEIFYRQHLIAPERRCLAQLLEVGDWRYVPQAHQKMMSVAVTAEAHLSSNGRKQYIYVMKDFGFCGTAGCSMLIGEERPGDKCQEIYDGHGSDIAITVLRKLDRGYKRLLTPCELRFDGHEYQQIHEECPNANVQR